MHGYIYMTPVLNGGADYTIMSWYNIYYTYGILSMLFVHLLTAEIMAPYIMLVQIEQSVCSFVRNLSSTEASVLMIIPSSDKLRYAKNDLMGTVTYPLHNADLYGVTVEAKIEKGIEPMLVIM